MLSDETCSRGWPRDFGGPNNLRSAHFLKLVQHWRLIWTSSCITDTGTFLHVEAFDSVDGVTPYMTVILGFNELHADSAACLVVDGKLLSAVAEERRGERHKHDSSVSCRFARAAARRRHIRRAVDAFTCGSRDQFYAPTRLLHKSYTSVRSVTNSAAFSALHVALICNRFAPCRACPTRCRHETSA